MRSLGRRAKSPIVRGCRLSTPKVTHAGGPQAKKIGTGVKLYKHHEWVCSLIDDVDEFLLNANEPHQKQHTNNQRQHTQNNQHHQEQTHTKLLRLGSVDLWQVCVSTLTPLACSVGLPYMLDQRPLVLERVTLREVVQLMVQVLVDLARGAVLDEESA